ncbi:MAG: hypothetical protein D6719_00175, partial [Candidatus Dadabacteria bacterium]
LLDSQFLNPHDPDDAVLLNKSRAFSFEKSFSSVLEKREGFDCIIGNPPYGLSRNNQLSELENSKLKQIYSDYRNGKVNKYILFMARGYELLNSTGVLSYIVPNSWLGIDGGKKIRELLLRNNSLAKLTLFTCPVFNEPGVEAVIFEAVKGKKYSRIELTRRNSIEAAEVKRSEKIPVSYCLASPGSAIPTWWSKDLQRILYKLRLNTITLGSKASPFVPLIALQAYARGKGTPPQSAEDVKNHVYDRDYKEDEYTLPYFKGSDIQRYAYCWSGNYLKYGAWLAEPQTPERFRGPRILLREIISTPPYSLIAAYCKETALYNKSVLHILPKLGTSEELVWMLLGILNSKVASFIILTQGRKSQRKLFPKIVNADLKDFPIPANYTTYAGKIASLSKELTDKSQLLLTKTEANNAANQVLSEQIDIRQREIDLLVAKAYRLSSRDLDTITGYLSGKAYAGKPTESRAAVA